METGGAARSVDHRRLQIIDDHSTGAGAEELQGMHQAAVELGLALRQGELDVDQPAVAEHGHEDRNLAHGGTDSHTAALAPINLHRLSRFIVDLLVHTPPRGAHGPQVAADNNSAARIAAGAAGNLLADTFP